MYTHIHTLTPIQCEPILLDTQFDLVYGTNTGMKKVNTKEHNKSRGMLN